MTRKSPAWSRAVKLGAASLALATLGACAAPFNADVNRFQAELPAPQGETFAVVAEDPAMAGGIEFGQYADLVTAKMAKLGYVPAADPKAAQLVVHFDYGVDDGREKIRATGVADPFYNPWYGYRPWYTRGRLSYVGRPWGYGFYDPWFDNGAESYTVYTSGIDMKIDRMSDGKRLFEGKAQAVSTSNRLQYLVPNLIDAMFTDFPGKSGETVRISIAPEKTTVRKIK